MLSIDYGVNSGTQSELLYVFVQGYNGCLGHIQPSLNSHVFIPSRFVVDFMSSWLKDIADLLDRATKGERIEPTLDPQQVGKNINECRKAFSRSFGKTD